MRIRLVVAAGAAAALALPLAANAETAPLLITGGGQVIADTSEPTTGAGDTIAFVARQTGTEDTANNADGSLQVVNTSEARANQRPSIIFNGEVTCIRGPEDGQDGSVARFGGVRRAGDGPAFFVVDVVDTGDENRGTDMIEFRETESPDPCEDDEDGTRLNGTTLARGNLKIDTANSGGGS
jgi:hypothetical protein